MLLSVHIFVTTQIIDYVESEPSTNAVLQTPVTANMVTEVFQWSQVTKYPLQPQ